MTNQPEIVHVFLDWLREATPQQATAALRHIQQARPALWESVQREALAAGRADVIDVQGSPITPDSIYAAFRALERNSLRTVAYNADGAPFGPADIAAYRTLLDAAEADAELLATVGTIPGRNAAVTVPVESEWAPPLRGVPGSVVGVLGGVNAHGKAGYPWDKDRPIPNVGTVRFIVRPGYGSAAAPIVGTAVLPLPDANLGDVVEVRLLPDGEAVWRVVHPGVLYADRGPGAHDFNELCSQVGFLCYPELLLADDTPKAVTP